MVEIIAPDRIMKCDFVCFFLASASLSFHPVFSNEFGIIITLFWASPVAQTVKNPPANAGDPSSISGLAKSAGEGIGYPLQYPWASQVAQLVKNLPTMWEICVRSLGWEDPMEKRKATHTSILAWRIPWTV